MDKKLLWVSVFSVSWALLIFFNKLALNKGANPLSFTVQGTAITVVLLTLYVAGRGKLRLTKLPVKDFSVIGFLVAAAYITGAYGLALSTSINYSFLIKSSLVFTLVLAGVFLKERFTKHKIQLMAVFAVGAYLLTTGGKVIMPMPGDMLTILAAFCFSSAVVMQKNLLKKLDADLLGWARVSFAFIMLLPFMIILRQGIFPIIALDLVVAGAVMNAILAVSMNRTMALSSASYLTMISMAVPVMNLGLGLLFLNEPLSTAQAFGGALIFISGILVHKLGI